MLIHVIINTQGEYSIFLILIIANIDIHEDYYDNKIMLVII